MDRIIKQAISQVQDIIKQQGKFAVDVDLSKFFDRVKLMTKLKNKIQDKRLMALIGKYLRAGVLVNN